jgi:validoxylamine A glucosyltransferase
MTTTPKLSIVIPTYNRSRFLMKALKAFHSEALPADQFEVIVSDDGSSDGTEELVRSFEANYRIKYCFQEDLGFRAAAARNAGARLADGEVLAFIDAGELPSPSFAASHLSAYKLRSVRRAMTGLIGGWSTGVSAHAEGMPVEQLYRSLPRETDPRYQSFARVGFNLMRLSLPPVLFWTGNCSIRTEDFWDVGGFDESFCGYGMEDVDLAYRLWDRGISFALCKEGWVVELIENRDIAANDQTSSRNMERFLRNCDPLTPAKEIMALPLSISLSLFMDLQDYYRSLTEWEIQAKGIDVLEEVQRFCQESPSGEQIAILGVGSSIPESRPDAILFDFDKDFIRTMRESGCGIHHRIGLRTGLPDNSIDSLLITSRMRGIWGRFGDSIMLEAKRVANNIHLAWS